MTKLQSWLTAFPGARSVPLFETDGLTVRTHLRGRAKDRRVPTRSPDFDAAVIQLVEAGLAREDWTGLVYVMGTGEGGAFTPRYVGKTERRGTRHDLSRNMANIRHNPERFARWGYGLDYHVGDLSHALFGFSAYRPRRASIDAGRRRCS